ncbi:MAG TPA: FKBP-type peptidyl-prolyl cis-trans isomerase [Candidatus Kapabacteria bacterium]|nr:FKBP-type peptidyl-prolyl cis-trans isomerase [Candidatus Kapabacteria bacterium]
MTTRSTLLTSALLLAGLLCAEAQTPDAMQTTASGLKYTITHHGDGAALKAGQFVVVHYRGMLTDSTVFDDSHTRNEPFTFALGKGQVIKGWDEGIALLHVGDRARLVIAPELGYGQKGAGKVIPPNATLIFDVDVLDVKDQTLGSALEKETLAHGAASARSLYDRIKKNGFTGYYLAESELNALGYRLLKEKRTKDAVAIFEIAADAFPESANVYDSLGEGYCNSGDRTRAITNYERSLKLDPKNNNAKEMLELLKGRNWKSAVKAKLSGGGDAGTSDH